MPTRAGGPAVGPGGRVPLVPEGSLFDCRDDFAGQVGWGRAWIRFQAVMIAVARGQGGGDFQGLVAPAVHEPGGRVERR